jgi:hypothetical protein
MKHLKLHFVVAAAAIAVGAFAPAAASAADQSVSGTTVSASLALGVPVAATFGTNLGTSSDVDTTGGTVPLTAIGPWIMRVSGSDGGKLKATAADALCTGATSILNNALRSFSTAALGNFTAAATTASPLTLSGTAAQIASGTGSNTVTLTYRYVPNATDQLTAGCPYTMTSTVVIAAS